jgi:hypothetical protein
MSVKLWLDDVRPALAGWVHAHIVQEAIDILNTQEVTDASLDHDLGLMPACDRCQFDADVNCHVDNCDCTCHNQLQPTGYDLVKWMAENNQWPTNSIKVHSANPVGRQNMVSVIEKYWHTT